MPADFTAPSGVQQDFLNIKAIDGFIVEAVIFQPQQVTPANTTIVIQVHGSGGNYAGDDSFIDGMLAEQGYAVLGINTRQHDENVNADNFFDIRKDIEAAVYTAKDMGFQQIVLNGHSLGNIQVQFYAATSWDPAIKGVLLTSMFANLPWKSRNILIKDEQNYHQLFQEAKQALAQGKITQTLPTEMGYLRGTTTPVTGQHFLTYRWDETSTASGIYWIKRIPLPILMMRGTNDPIILDFEPIELLGAATSEGSIVPSIKYVQIQGAGHSLSENQDAVVSGILSWLTGLGLQPK